VIYLSGGHPRVLPDGVGELFTPMKNNKPREGRWWAADTGCFKTPEKHSDDGYIAWLDGLRDDADRCLFATAPDVLGNAEATLALSAPMLERIRETGYKAALIAQDGMERCEIPWNAFDCLFMGGTTGWKLSEPAFGLMAEARQRGKWVHVGRVNSYRRLVRMRQVGAHSVDGTHLAFRPDVNARRLDEWFVKLAVQPDLMGVA
jgi:hypothetical protein